MTYYGDEAFPALSDGQWARLQAYGSAQEVESGALLWGAGEATYDLILVDSGEQRSSGRQPRGRPGPSSPISAGASSSAS
jgi:hypothetical protein